MLGAINRSVQETAEFEHPFPQTAFISCDFEVVFV
jgi:hypothetical protein